MNWQERLNAHEEIAPLDGWDKLRDCLELDRSGLKEKMLALETEVPADAWPRIQQSLKPGMPLKAVPRIIPFLRKHAAAAGFAASLAVVFFIYSGSSDNTSPTALGLATEMSPTISSPELKTASKNPSIKKMAYKETSPTSEQSGTKSEMTVFTIEPRLKTSLKSLNVTTNKISLKSDLNYIEICNQEGQCDRLTYKLEDWASCLHASCPESKGLSADKNRQIEAWKSRLEQSSYVPAAGHFFDIAEMAAFLQTAEDR